MTTQTLPEAPIDQQDVEKTQENSSSAFQGGNSDTDDGSKRSEEQESSWSWDTDLHNPYNWSSRQKALQVIAIASIAFLAYVLR